MISKQPTRAFFVLFINSGRIEGTVKDPQGQVIPNAALTITNTGTSETLRATSSGAGVFVVAEVKSGTYRVTAEAQGFKKITVEGVVVQVATVSTVNLDEVASHSARQVS